MKQFKQERLYVPELNNLGYMNTNFTKSGCEVTQQSPLALGITVGAGIIYFSASSEVSVSETDVTIDTADASDRIDMVAVNNAGTPSIIKGTVNLVDPTLPETTSYDPDDYIILGRVLVATGATTISNAAIDDLRNISEMNNELLNTKKINTLGSNMSYTNVSAGLAATQLLAERVSRNAALVYNNSENSIYIGDASVSTSTGYLLSTLTAYEIKNKSAIYGIVETTTSDARIIEVYK